MCSTLARSLCLSALPSPLIPRILTTPEQTHNDAQTNTSLKIWQVWMRKIKLRTQRFSPHTKNSGRSSQTHQNTSRWDEGSDTLYIQRFRYHDSKMKRTETCGITQHFMSQLCTESSLQELHVMRWSQSVSLIYCAPVVLLWVVCENQALVASG